MKYILMLLGFPFYIASFAISKGKIDATKHKNKRQKGISKKDQRIIDLINNYKGQ